VYRNPLARYRHAFEVGQAVDALTFRQHQVQVFREEVGDNAKLRVRLAVESSFAKIHGARYIRRRHSGFQFPVLNRCVVEY
jgi:hypothetical protein